jgi:hypothetical protein
LPFLMLYREGQRLHGIERPLGEVIRFSADVYGYLSAPEALRVWGRVVQAYPKPEGELFPGAVAILLVATVAFTAIRSTSSSAAESPSPARTWMARLLLLIAGIQTAALIAILFTGGFITSFAGLPVRATNPARIATGIALVLAVLLAVSPAARSAARGAARSTVALSLVLGLLALWLSLGPMPQSAGRPLPGIAVYGVLYDHVPGFSGLRVPARYAMVASVFLSIVAGAGASALLGRFRRRTAGALLAAAAIGDVWFAPMPLNQTWGDSTPTPPAHIEPAAQAPAIYRSIASMDDAQVIVEFPFGDPAWELRYVYYSAVHWKRLINGYSGAFPPGYKVRVARLQRVNDNPDAAWATIIEAGATHAIVHSGALPPGQSEYLRNWLTVRGAVAVEESGGDWLFALPPR